MARTDTLTAPRAHARRSLPRTRTTAEPTPAADDLPRIDRARLADLLRTGAASLRRMAEIGSVNVGAAFAALDRLGLLALDALRLGAMPEARTVLAWWTGQAGAEEELFPGSVARIPHGANALEGLARVLFPESLTAWPDLVGDDPGKLALALLRGADAADAVAASIAANSARGAELERSAVPLDETDRLLLDALRKHGVGSCVLLIELANAIGRARSSIGPRLARLAAVGLVDRPRGKRGGFTLTDAGLATVRLAPALIGR